MKPFILLHGAARARLPHTCSFSFDMTPLLPQLALHCNHTGVLPFVRLSLHCIPCRTELGRSLLLPLFLLLVEYCSCNPRTYDRQRNVVVSWFSNSSCSTCTRLQFSYSVNVLGVESVKLKLAVRLILQGIMKTFGGGAK